MGRVEEVIVFSPFKKNDSALKHLMNERPGRRKEVCFFSLLSEGDLRQTWFCFQQGLKISFSSQHPGQERQLFEDNNQRKKQQNYT